jgi:hypothetical protein
MESSAAGPIEPGDLTIVPANQATWANGARALEGYAMRTQPGREITWGELQVFADAGFTEVSSPSVRRAVMRVEFPAGKQAEFAFPS